MSAADLARATAGARAAAIANGARLPMAFIAFGLGSLAHALGCLAIEPALLIVPHISPSVLSLVHAWIPGFLVSVCLGACYQMMPVVLGVPLACARWRAWAHLAVHVVGATVLISGFLRGRYELVAAGGVLVVIGIASYVQVTWRTFARSLRRDAVAWSFPLSATWLLATVALGVAIAIDRRWGLIGMPTVQLVPAHAHLGFAGFFLTLLQGVTFQLVPMFTMGEPRRERFAACGLIATQVGLVCLADGLATGVRTIAMAGAIVIACGVAASGVAFVATLRTRRRRLLEMPLRAFVAGAALAPVAAIVGLVLVALPVGSVPLRAIELYGVLVIAGALSLAVLGMLGKIVPFLVWMTAYGPRAGKEPVPVATALASKPLERAWLWAHLAGVAAACAAAAAESLPFAWAAAMLLTGAGAAYLWNVGRVGRHLFRRGPVAAGVAASQS